MRLNIKVLFQSGPSAATTFRLRRCPYTHTLYIHVCTYRGEAMHIHVEIRTWKEREGGGEEQVKREGEKGKERETTSHGRTSPDRSGIFPLDWNLIKLKICQFRKKHPTAYIDGGHYTPVARQRGRELVGLTTPVQIKTHRRARTPRADRPEPRPTHGPLFLRSLSLPASPSPLIPILFASL